VSDVYDVILDDLEWSYDHISELAEADPYVGRVSKDVVRHYWAKVLLTRASYEPDPADDPDNYVRGGNPTEDLQKATELIEEIHTAGRHRLLDDYADLFEEGNELNDEIIFSAQFNADVNLNGTDGSEYKNQLHEVWFNQYDYVNLQGMARALEYGRPFRRLMLTDYAINIHDRLNDSRLRKQLLEVYYSTEVDADAMPVWTEEELLFAFDDVAADGSWAIRHDDTVRAGEIKFEGATAGGDGMIVGDTALVFLLNDESTTLTDRQIIAAGYWLFPRYYWTTNADGSLNELVTFDRDNAELDYDFQNVVGSTDISTCGWTRNFSPSLVKYWDRQKPDGYNSHVGSRDVFLARLAESYLIAAEAYGRLGNYTKAVEFINHIRRRAAYQDGEEKPGFWQQYDGGSPADQTASTVDNMLIDETYWDDDSHDDAELYPDGVDTKEERFIHFILNEKSRELLGEMIRWEDLVRTNTLLLRATTFNNDTRNRAAIQKFHRLRPIPNAHLNSIKIDGIPLTPAEKQAYQNEGYY
jgi:hypothetical protein